MMIFGCIGAYIFVGLALAIFCTFNDHAGFEWMGFNFYDFDDMRGAKCLLTFCWPVFAIFSLFKAISILIGWLTDTIALFVGKP